MIKKDEVILRSENYSVESAANLENLEYIYRDIHDFSQNMTDCVYDKARRFDAPVGP